MSADLDPARALALCAGHFPGEPLLPGAQLVALMAELGAEVAGPGVRLARVEQAIFRHRVTPAATITVAVRRDGDVVRATVAHDGRPAASAMLRYEPRT